MDTNATRKRRHLFWLGLIIVILGANSCGSNPLARPVANQPTPTPALGIGVVNTPQVVGSPEPSSPIHIKTPLAESTQEATVGPAAETPTIQLPTFTPTGEPSSTPSPTPAESKSSSDGVAASPTPVLYPTTTWKPPQITAADVPDNWLTYVDEEAGYSFKYPPDVLHISAGKSVGDKYKHVSIDLPFSGEFRPIMVVFVQDNINNLTFEQYLVNRYTNCAKRSDIPPEYLAAAEEMKINGFPTIWSKADCASEIFITINTSDKFFGFLVTNGVIVSDLRTVDDISKDTFYQIVNTFTLLSTK